MSTKITVQGGERYDNKLPDKLRLAFRESVQDEALLRLRQEIALIDAYIQERVELLADQTEGGDKGGVDGVTYARLETLADRYEHYKATGQLAKALPALHELFAIIRRERRVGELWNDIFRATEKRRVLVESEQKHLLQAQRLIETSQVIIVLNSVIDILRESISKYVADTETRGLVLAEANRRYIELLGVGPDRQRDRGPMDAGVRQ